MLFFKDNFLGNFPCHITHDRWRLILLLSITHLITSLIAGPVHVTHLITSLIAGPVHVTHLITSLIAGPVHERLT